MNDEEKWKRCLNVTEKQRAPISEFVGRTPLCRVYASWVEDCKTCSWYNSHLLDYKDLV